MDEQNKPLGQTPTNDDQSTPGAPANGPEVTVDFNQAPLQDTGNDGGLGTTTPPGAVGSVDAPSISSEPTLAGPGPDGAVNQAPQDPYGRQPSLDGQPNDALQAPSAPTPPPATDNSFDPAAPAGEPAPAAFPPQDSTAQPQPFDPTASGTPQSPVDSAIPPTAPVTAPASEKRTILILAGVAVVLVIAIGVLFFL